jgi:hypothetical protein
MTDRPEILASGERARLFPVLADTSKEGRTLSILLACFETVDVFGKSLLSDVGVKIGSRTKIETYTEVVLKTFRRQGVQAGWIDCREVLWRNVDCAGRSKGRQRRPDQRAA